MHGCNRASVFRIGSAAFLVAAAYHLAALLIPPFAAAAYPPGYPAVRHVTFIVINVTFSWLFVWRPRWLVWPYAILAAQVVNGHGRAAWRLWREQQRFDWISVLVTAGVAVGLCVLVMDYRERATEIRPRT